MYTLILVLTVAATLIPAAAFAADPAFERDHIQTSAGDLEIGLVGHGTLMFTWNGLVVHVDPWTKLADYAKLPKADLILITHAHFDHLDQNAIKTLQKDKTIILVSAACAGQVAGAQTIRNGDSRTVSTIKVEAAPAYNIVQKNPQGGLYHPKGEGNGYVLTFGDKRVYVAGDTENTPEMKALKNIDLAFLPMNLPYTMTPEMVADAAKAFRPRVLYPYHTGETDVSKLAPLLSDCKDIELRVRKMN